MVGDRYLTDVVFGNRNGMLTIRPAPFTAAGEPMAVAAVSEARGEGAPAVRAWGGGQGRRRC